MGLLNTKKSGLFAMVQPSVAPNGSIVPTSAMAPQQTILANASATFENSPIETTHTLGMAFSQPGYPGAISGTVSGVAKATTGYSKCFMVNGYPVVTNSAKKMLNNGNTFMAPMVQATKAKTYCYVADSGSGGGGSFKNGRPFSPEELDQIYKTNPPWPQCRKLRPTPAPQSLLGTCKYYQWRNQDFINRHQGCDHLTPPDYYLNYGYKYCERFSKDVYPLMGPQGKKFLTNVRMILQIKLEALLKSNSSVELSNDKFRDAVFATHRSAYEEAGVVTLNPAEQVVIGLTPDLSTWHDPAARAQASEITKYIVENEYEQALTDPQNYFRFTYYYLTGGPVSAIVQGT